MQRVGVFFVILMGVVLMGLAKHDFPLLSVVHVSSMGDIRRAALTIASFVQNIPDDSFIADYFLVLPDKGVNATLCGVKPEKFQLHCIEETRVLNTTYRAIRKWVKKPKKNDPSTTHNTWRLQMLLKLAVAPHIRTRYFITVDSDTLLIKRVENIQWLLPNYKARVASETRGIHGSWYNASERLLHAKGCLDDGDTNQLAIGVTPAILHRDTMSSVYARIARLYGAEDKHILRATLGAGGHSSSWTEYSLYRVMGCLRADFFKWHEYRMPPGTPSLYYGLWSDEDFAKMMDNDKSHVFENFLFLIMQDNHVNPDTDLMQQLLRHVFCPPRFKNDFLRLKFLPKC